jgi:hypothetical protein
MAAVGSVWSRLFQPQAPVSRRAVALVVLLAVVLLTVNILLLRRNAQLTEVAGRAARAYLPAVGATVPDLLGLDLNGAVRTVSYGSDRRDTLLFVFSPDCGMSNLAWERWSALIKAADQSAVRLLFANIGPSLPSGHSVRGLTLDPASVLEVDARSLVAYNLQVSPQILRITPDRRVADVWVGTLDEQEEDALLRALRIETASRSTDGHIVARQ